MKKLVVLAASLTLSLGVSAPTASAQRSAMPGASAWEIGPVIKGRNYSVNMPLRMDSARDGLSFDFPSVPDDYGHVHYVTFDPGTLRGAKSITIKYRIDAKPGTRFIAQERPGEQANLSLYFQRRGDNWTAKRHYEHYRWYSPHETMIPLRTGTVEVTMPLDGRWQSVGLRPASENPQEFAASLDRAGRLGFVFGWSHGRGHGVYATAPARFTLLDFKVN